MCAFPTSVSWTVLMFSASSSGISTSNSSSIAMTSSTMSSESAPRSSMKLEVILISSSETPSCSAMMPLTFVSTFVAVMMLLPCVGFRTAGHPRLHVHAAVDADDPSGHVRRLVARQPGHAIGDVLGSAETREWDRLGQLRLGGLRERLRHGRVDEPRGDRIHADVA